MFYCDRCATKNAWPKTFFHSTGPCEVCKQHADCNEMPSKYLPVRHDKRSTDEPEVPS